MGEPRTKRSMASAVTVTAGAMLLSVN